LVERENLCVRLSRTVVKSSADYATVLDYQGADHGVRTGLSPALRREAKRQGHEVEVRCSSGHRFLRVTRDRLRICRDDFFFVVFVVAFFACARDLDTLRTGSALLDPVSANAA
jgi:hypothetical protein